MILYIPLVSEQFTTLTMLLSAVLHLLHYVSSALLPPKGNYLDQVDWESPQMFLTVFDIIHNIKMTNVLADTTPVVTTVTANAD